MKGGGADLCFAHDAFVCDKLLCEDRVFRKEYCLCQFHVFDDEFVEVFNFNPSVVREALSFFCFLAGEFH